MDTKENITEHNIRLTSAEIANLWGAYLGNSMSVCVLQYFCHHVEDKEIKEVLEYALSHLFLNYLHQTTKSGFSLYTIALPNVARADVRDFMSECIVSLTELYNKVANVSLSKGLFIRPPYIIIPDDVEFVQSKGFLAGFIGDIRPLNALEITHIFSNIETNALGKAIVTGFSQVAQSEEIREYFNRGKEIALKQIEVFSNTLKKDDLPAPMTWDHDVMESKSSPFSDKLMLFHVTGLNALGIYNYGAALSGSQRHDLHVEYGRLLAEIGLYGEAGARLMIKNQWLEQTPLATDRKALVKV
jgi:hypothetical protein